MSLATSRLSLDPSSIEDYRRFLRIKTLPTYSIKGRSAEVPAEYAHLVEADASGRAEVEYEPWPGLFDYQRDLSRLAIQRRKFAGFLDCGLGKSLILAEFARTAARELAPQGKSVLIVTPLMVVPQMEAEFRRFYGDAFAPEVVRASGLPDWARAGSGVGITNYEALTDRVEQGRVGALLLDESSMLKSHYGKWARRCIRLGKGLVWKLCMTGTPAPNDRVEYANHAVFLDQFPSVNSFLAKFFINRGETSGRWEMKRHAVGPFYRALSHWSFFMVDPGAHGWKDNAGGVPPIHVHLHNVDLTESQRAAIREKTGRLFACEGGGITSRAALSRIAKGTGEIGSNKPAAIAALVASWPTESTIVWCRYNEEQDALARLFPDAANIDGSTNIHKRLLLIDEFKAGRRKVLISKPKILGFGLNLQVATRHVFSTLQDSYEEYYQAVKRSNRYGSNMALNVHIPVTEAEVPMIENVLRKAREVQADGQEQERTFREHSYGF